MIWILRAREIPEWSISNLSKDVDSMDEEWYKKILIRSIRKFIKQLENHGEKCQKF
jgi:hypothetical protein